MLRRQRLRVLPRHAQATPIAAITKVFVKSENLLLGSSLLLWCSFLCGLGCFLGSWLLGSWLLGLLGGGLLLGGSLLLGLLNLDQLEAPGSLAALLGHLQGSLLDASLQGHAEVLSGLGGVHLVVGADVLEDGLAGGASPVLQRGDGGGDHDGVLGVGGGGLGLGGLLCCGLGVSHVGVLWWSGVTSTVVFVRIPM